MAALRFDEDKCLACPTCDCLVKCRHIEIAPDRARIEIGRIVRGEASSVLHDCVTCYGCEEYCPNGNHPFYLIVQRQEELGISPLPEPLVKRGIQLGMPYRGEPEIREVSGTALNMGVFSPLAGRVGGRLFEGLTLISADSRKMFHYFCQLMYLHFGKVSIINERLKNVIAVIAAHKAQAVVHFHDECFGTYTSYAPAFGIEVPFKSIHLFEYLYDRLQELESDIRPLKYRAAYQRPCSSRLSPEKHRLVAPIFDLIGIQPVEREYVDENALCCGATILGQKREGSRRYCAELQRKNIEDMQKAGAQICIFNCPACMQTLGKAVAKRGIMPLFMSDLCRLAVGETVA